MDAKPAMIDASGVNSADMRPSVFFLCVFLFCASLLILGYSVIFSPLDHDEYEHLYSAYLMLQGQIPYRDFFQHHHFLYWIFLAPFVKNFPDTYYLLYIGRSLSLCALLITAFYTYKISILKGGDKKSVFLFVTVLLSIDMIVHSSLLVRPDIFMVGAFFSGLYYYIIYLKNKNLLCLVLSFLLFFASFLFLQKAVFLLFGFCLCAIYQLYKKELYLRDFLIALVLPLSVLGYLLYFMSEEHVLVDYFELNWLFNFKISMVYGWVRLKLPLFFCSISLIIAEVRIIKRAPFQFTSIIFLGFCVFFALLPTPYEQYYIPLFPFLVITLSSSFSILQDRKIKNAIVALLLLLVFYNAVQNVSSFVMDGMDGCVKRQYDIVLRVTSEDEEILGSHEVCPVRRDVQGYYWHNLELSQLDTEHFSRGKELYDIPELIMAKSPKVLWVDFVDGYFNDSGFKDFIEQNYTKICNIYVAKSIPPEVYQN
ncbi:ArnT family glycosyltransferase [Desulfovibrio intestinalis]|uniref:Glycosyltransferase RgtA/B/C/D-like domain-containing protein n=1 Tax=Desulfovibrio intestinalis TaxID=58621 RepID=A0A7W8FFZ3_9BACT|nr:hypothetical protein [Desulfovibrio intestinalis]MBB5143195.1 hypothetical protein [Desulfovibrio intestinalis]